MSRGIHRGAGLRWLVVAFGCTGALSAQAQDAAPVDADQLFEEGKARMAAGDYAAACPLLAASHAAEPATGAVLALAMCHERAGKLESAYEAYVEAAERSQQEQNAEREQAARSQAESLSGLRSTLEVVLVSNTDGAQVRLDGETLDAARLGSPFGIDGGPHQLQVVAPGKEPFQVELEIAERQDKQRVVVAAMAEAPAKAGRTPGPAAASRSHAAPRKWSAETWIGLGTAGAGVAALFIGTGLAVGGKNHENERASDAAGLYFALGGVLTGTGALLFFATNPFGWGEDADVDSDVAAASRIDPGILLLPGGGGVSATARF